MRHWSIATVSTLVPGLYEQAHCSNPLTPLLIMVLHACLPEVWSCFWLLSFCCVFNMRTHPFLAPMKHRRIRVIEGLWVMVQMVVGEQRSNREWGQLPMLVFAKYGTLHRFFFFSFFLFSFPQVVSSPLCSISKARFIFNATLNSASSIIYKEILLWPPVLVWVHPFTIMRQIQET